MDANAVPAQIRPARAGSDLGTIPDRFAGHGGGDALMMNYVCELIAAGGAGRPHPVDASVESHVMALAAEHSRHTRRLRSGAGRVYRKNNALFRPCSRAAGTGAAGRPGGKPFTAKGRAGLCTTNKEAAMEAF